MSKDEVLQASDRDGDSGAKAPLVRIRASDVLLAVPLAIVVSLFSYVRRVDRDQYSDRTKEHAVIRAEIKEYTNDQIVSLRTSFDEHRKLEAEINRRQDAEIEWMRKALVQVR